VQRLQLLRSRELRQVLGELSKLHRSAHLPTQPASPADPVVARPARPRQVAPRTAAAAGPTCRLCRFGRAVLPGTPVARASPPRGRPDPSRARADPEALHQAARPSYWNSRAASSTQRASACGRPSA
jgi:hypothetical protein